MLKKVWYMEKLERKSLSHKQKLLYLGRNFPWGSFAIETCSFSLVKWTEIFNIHYNFHRGNKKERCGSLDLWILAWSRSKATVEPGLPQRWGLDPDRGLSLFALETLATTQLLPFRMGRLEAHRAEWPAQRDQGLLNGLTSSLGSGSRDSHLSTLTTVLGGQVV